MHAFNLAIKRAHIRVVEAGKRMFEEMRVPNMTPARFDLMYALFRTARNPRPGVPLRVMLPTSQSGLRKALGVSRATISKMISRLVEIGWLTKERRTTYDRRTNDIAFTEEGRRIFHKVSRRVFRMRTWLALYERIVTYSDFGYGQHVLDALQMIWLLLFEVANEFGDTSELRYDFGCGFVPEDCDRDPQRHTLIQKSKAILAERKRREEARCETARRGILPCWHYHCHRLRGLAECAGTRTARTICWEPERTFFDFWE